MRCLTFDSFNMWLLIRSPPGGAAEMIDLIRKKFFKNDETVLFLHTGGQPALFADKYANNI